MDDAAADLRTALASLAAHVERAGFELPAVASEARRGLRDDALGAVRDHLLPRLAQLDAPVVAVVVGPTGAGKSTLVNSLAGAEVSTAGPLRPTTREPVVWTHRDAAGPDGRSWDRVGPVQVVTHDDPAMAGVTLVDAPDLDSVETRNRELADDLLAVADLCVFVTSAQRYADAIPWDVLRGVRARDLPLVLVCNRLPPDGEAVVADLRRRLAAEGDLVADAVVTIAESEPVAATSRLPADRVAVLRERLERLADPGERREVVLAAVRSGLQRVGSLVREVQEAVTAERREVAALRTAASDAYAEQADVLARSLRDGQLIRDEVLVRWQEYVGTGELLRVLGQGAGRVRGWLRSVFGGTQRAADVRAEAGSTLAEDIARRADRAAAGAATSWELSDAGRQLLSPDLVRVDPATAPRARAAVDDWMAGLAALVEELGASRRRTARAASIGVNVAAVSAMLAVFAQTGGLTGAEVGITAGAAAVQQRLLEHLFGTAAARQLVTEGRERLDALVADVMGADLRRWTDRVDPLAPPEGLEDELAAALDAVEAHATSAMRAWGAHG